ncbi:MAG TPA: lactate utilization protein B/C, partial [Chitinophagaceae bacterium]|nr:lactate utilization protein B/C [Chitinophagaceae bacterium]
MKQTMSDQSKNRILSKIKQALAKPVPEPFTSVKPNLQNIYTPTQQELEIEFAENFTQLSGKFSFCTNEQELANQLNHLTSSRNWNKIFCREPELKYILSLNNFKNFEHNDLNTCQVSITSCEFLVARTGSIFLSSLQKSGRNT